MKHLNYYSNKNLHSADDAFTYLFKTIIPKTRTWDFFCKLREGVLKVGYYVSKFIDKDLDFD